jgi:S1-C subfamily serine protease
MKKSLVLKTFVTLFLLATFVLPAKAQDSWSGVVDKVLKSVVYLEIESPEGTGGCSGFVVDAQKHYIQTAAHCDPGGNGRLWVDNVAANIVAKDTKKDLAIFEVKNLDPTRPALKLASSDPKIGDEVMSVGYGMALERPIFRKAMISDTALSIPEDGIGGPFIATDSAFVGGQSGGPVVNRNGEVVMIVQRASGTVGIGVGAEIIKEHMGRFWSNK